MGSSVSRDQSQVYPPESSSCHDLNSAVDGARGAEQPALGHGARQQVHQRPGHTYTGNTIGDESKAHLGDLYAHTVNYMLSDSQNPSSSTKARDAFLAALWFDQMSFRHSAINPAYAETSRWVLETAEFTRWRDPALLNPDHNIFWLKGKPGAGKSTIMRTVLEFLQEEDPDTIIVSFFFNARGQPLEQSVEGLYRTMLHQLLSKDKSLFAAIERQHAYAKTQTWTIEALRGLLYDVVLSLRRGRVLFLVDALDEGDERESEAEKQEFVDAIGGKARGVFLWVVLVVNILNTRYDHGATKDQLLRTLSTTPADLNELLGNILRAGLSDDRLVPALVCVLFHVRSKLRLGELYFAIRLSTDDIDLDDCSCRRTKIGLVRRYIVSASKGLVEIVEECDEDDSDYDDKDDDERYTVQFIHESVREHLLSGALAELHPALLPDVEASSHAMLAELCQAYVQKVFPACMAFPTNPATGTISVKRLEDDDVRAFRSTDAFSFFDFVVESTFQHLNIAYEGGRLEVDALKTFPTTQWINMKNIELFASGTESPWYLKSSVSLLYLLIIERCSMAAIALCKYYKTSPASAPYDQHYRKGKKIKRSHWEHPLTGKGLNAACGSTYGSLLSAAAACGTADIVKLVLELGADVNNQVGRTDNPIYWASQRGDLEICRLLLDHGADVNKQTKQYNTPLSVAADNGHLDIVRLLLERGADPNKHATESESPLVLVISLNTTSVSEGHNLDTLRLLLDCGADVNGQARLDLTPLHKAATGGLVDVCRLLLDRGADLATPGRLDLLIAAAKGFSDTAKQSQVLQLLLDRSAHVSSHELTEIMFAAYYRWEGLEVLLEHGADPTSADQFSQTALHSCAEHPQDDEDVATSMRKLLDFGANPNAVGGQYGTALIAASAGGRASYVRVLLDHGADMDHRNGKHGTAIEAARKNGHSDVEEALLEETALRERANAQESQADANGIGPTLQAVFELERLRYRDLDMD